MRWTVFAGGASKPIPTTPAALTACRRRARRSSPSELKRHPRTGPKHPLHGREICVRLVMQAGNEGAALRPDLRAPDRCSEQIRAEEDQIVSSPFVFNEALEVRATRRCSRATRARPHSPLGPRGSKGVAARSGCRRAVRLGIDGRRGRLRRTPLDLVHSPRSRGRRRTSLRSRRTSPPEAPGLRAHAPAALLRRPSRCRSAEQPTRDACVSGGRSARSPDSHR